jgi:glutathione peroxidase
MRSTFTFLLLSFVAAAALAVGTGDGRPAMSFYELETRNLDGTPANLGAYKGKVALVVNTASECGYTPQYKGLQELSDQYATKGLVVLGFPSNDFGGQEPGTAKQIREFCDRKFAVKFPLFEKVQTKGSGKSPVYAFLTAKHGEPKWNFHKYLVGKDGQVLQAFGSGVAPESRELRDAIEAALK